MHIYVNFLLLWGASCPVLFWVNGMDHLHRSRDWWVINHCWPWASMLTGGTNLCSHVGEGGSRWVGHLPVSLLVVLFSVQGVQLPAGWGDMGVLSLRWFSRDEPLLQWSQTQSTVPSSQTFYSRVQKIVFPREIPCRVSWGPWLPSAVVLNFFTASTDPWAPPQSQGLKGPLTPFYKYFIRESKRRNTFVGRLMWHLGACGDVWGFWVFNKDSRGLWHSHGNAEPVKNVDDSNITFRCLLMACELLGSVVCVLWERDGMGTAQGFTALNLLFGGTLESNSCLSSLLNQSMHWGFLKPHKLVSVELCFAVLPIGGRVNFPYPRACC